MDYKVFIVRMKEKPYAEYGKPRWSELEPDFDVFTLRDIPICKDDMLMFLSWACRGTGVIGMDIKEIRDGE